MRFWPRLQITCQAGTSKGKSITAAVTDKLQIIREVAELRSVWQILTRQNFDVIVP